MRTFWLPGPRLFSCQWSRHIGAFSETVARQPHWSRAFRLQRPARRQRDSGPLADDKRLPALLRLLQTTPSADMGSTTKPALETATWLACGLVQIRAAPRSLQRGPIGQPPLSRSWPSAT